MKILVFKGKKLFFASIMSVQCLESLQQMVKIMLFDLDILDIYYFVSAVIKS